MAQIPTLLQLCAEEVAKLTRGNGKIRKRLREIELPPITISYVRTKLRKTCDFSKFGQKEMGDLTVLPTVAQMPDNYKFRIRVGSGKMLYISTLADLGGDMLKLDFPAGKYKVFPFNDGYILKSKNYSPKLQDVIHIFNTGDGDKGLCDKFNVNQVENCDRYQMFQRFINDYLLANEVGWKHYTHDVVRRTSDLIRPGYFIPVLFYLTEYINIDDLSKISLSCGSELYNCGNVAECRYVLHSVKGKIGIAVKQRMIYNMIGTEGGVALFAFNGFRAIGNFRAKYEYPLPDDVNKTIFEPHHHYECEFDPCFCDFRL